MIKGRNTDKVKATVGKVTVIVPAVGKQQNNKTQDVIRCDKWVSTAVYSFGLALF